MPVPTKASRSPDFETTLHAKARERRDALLAGKVKLFDKDGTVIVPKESVTFNEQGTVEKRPDLDAVRDEAAFHLGTAYFVEVLEADPSASAVEFSPRLTAAKKVARARFDQLMAVAGPLIHHLQEWK